MRLPKVLLSVLLCVSFASMLSAQDAVKTDPKHYSVISENDQVRILKVHYGAHEKSVMHSHPDSVAVFLTDATVQFTLPDGKKQTMTVKAGDSQFTKAGIHLPENTTGEGMDLVLVELKGNAAKGMSMGKK
jgi:quercetin dioxygenase-like cupin family protein